jgi:hypothetical protein
MKVINSKKIITFICGIFIISLFYKFSLYKKVINPGIQKIIYNTSLGCSIIDFLSDAEYISSARPTHLQEMSILCLFTK